MDSNSGQDSIQVFIRIRPYSQQQSIISFTETEIKLEKHQFGFDKIFPPSSNQTDIFHHVGNRLLGNVLDGYNSCVFVYGQTGSGKTHTMIGQNNGLMQQSFHQLFSRINRMKNAECLVTCSYFQLYNEQIMDLLEPKKQKKLHIRQDAKRGVFVQNLAEQTALDCDKLMDVLYTGMKNRHIGQTQMNRESSRSHSVFTISLSCKIEENGKKILKTPKLHFVDLAGSERQKMTQASGQRLKEAGNINRSLTTLGMVINALTSQKSRTHIPYRDSKLTCLLRDSLGGNSKTIIIATVSTLPLSFQQTLSTLNFANRAKMVKVKALVNEESLSSNIEVFKEEIRLLKAEIMRLKTTDHHKTPLKVVVQEVKSPKQLGTQLDHHFEEINKKISDISNQLTQGITSPSLEALLSNLNGKKSIVSTDTMMDEQNIEEMDSGADKYSPTEFIEYLNSNYELLSQINTKISQYAELKDELRHSAMNKKLSIESMLTPSKFQRDQYEQLLVKRQKQIQQLQDKLQELQANLNIILIEKKDMERKIDLYHQNKFYSTEELDKIRNDLIEKEMELERQKNQSQKLKTQLMRVQKFNHQLQQRFKQTKELHLYAQEKYENQRFTTSKLASKIQQFEREIHQQKKILQTIKEAKSEVQNELQNFKIQLEDKESQEEELKNQLNEMEETLQFNKKTIEDLAKKNVGILNEVHKNKQMIDGITNENSQMREQNHALKQRLEQQSLMFGRQIQDKSSHLKQAYTTNERLNNQLTDLSNELIQQRQTKLAEFQRNREQMFQIRRVLKEKESQLLKTSTEMHAMEDYVEKIKTEKQATIQNFSIKHQAKVIQCNMLQQKLSEYKRQVEALIDQLKKQLETGNSKLESTTSIKDKLQEQNKEINQKLNEALKKISSIQHIYDENQQFKKSYKELVKENYRLKGKYQNVNQNEELQKQKSDQLLSKVQFYEEKFKLMSMEYHKIESIVKKLKEKQLEANKKIQFYQENIKLIQIEKTNGEDTEEKDHLICELKQQNRELKYKLDSLQGNMTQNVADKSSENGLNSKKSKDERQTVSLSIKYDKFRTKLKTLMKNWQGFANRSQEEMATQEMIDLCEIMLNQNAIKFETIAKGIRREQKLRSQNHFILKENIYLKEKVEQFQKNRLDQQKQVQSRPRKVVKTE